MIISFLDASDSKCLICLTWAFLVWTMTISVFSTALGLGGGGRVGAGTPQHPSICSSWESFSIIIVIITFILIIFAGQPPLLGHTAAESFSCHMQLQQLCWLHFLVDRHKNSQTMCHNLMKTRCSLKLELTQLEIFHDQSFVSADWICHSRFIWLAFVLWQRCAVLNLVFFLTHCVLVKTTVEASCFCSKSASIFIYYQVGQGDNLKYQIPWPLNFC